MRRGCTLVDLKLSEPAPYLYHTVYISLPWLIIHWIVEVLYIILCSIRVANLIIHKPLPMNIPRVIFRRLEFNVSLI